MISSDIEKHFLEERCPDAVTKERVHQGDDSEELESETESNASGSTLNDDSDDSQDIEEQLHQVIQDQERRHELNLGGPNTGVKGVLADYEFHKLMSKLRQQKENERLLQDMNRFSLTQRNNDNEATLVRYFALEHL
jgi:hypothetical protein